MDDQPYFNNVKMNLLLKSHLYHICQQPILWTTLVSIFSHLHLMTKNQGLSTEDRAFLQEMTKEFKKNADGYWEVPLPFRSQRPRSPNNRAMALDRASRFDAYFEETLSSESIS